MDVEDKVEEEKINKFFDNKKLYTRIGLIGIGLVLVFIMFKKMKNEYVS